MIRAFFWFSAGLSALAVAAAQPITLAVLLAAWVVYSARGGLFALTSPGSRSRARRRGTPTNPGDPVAHGLSTHRVVRLTRDWFLELGVLASILWLPPGVGLVVALWLLAGVLNVVAPAAFAPARRLAERSPVAGAAIGPVLAAADVFVRRHVRRGWRKAMSGTGLPTPRVRAHRNAAGWVLDFKTRGAWAPSHYERVSDSLAATLHAREVRIVRDREDGARGTLHVLVGDLLATDLGPPPWAGRGESLWGTFAIGRDETGEPVTITNMPYETMLVGGVKGSGKSKFLDLLIARAVADPNCTLWVADGKGLDFEPWRPHCRKFAEGADVNQMRELLADVNAWMEQRRAELKAAGREKARPGDPCGLLVVDEVTVWDMQSRKEPMRNDLTHAVQRGRAHGLGAVVATQRPEAGQDGAMPALIRDNLDLKVAFRVSRKGTSDTILGPGWGDDGFDASKLPEGRPGVAIANVDGNPRVMWAYNLPRPAEPTPEPKGWQTGPAEPMGSTVEPAPEAAGPTPEPAEPSGTYPTSEIAFSSGSAPGGRLGHGHTAGGQRSPTYRSWRAARNRCRNPNADQWSRYGGIGTRFCKGWDDYASFVLDLGERPEAHTLERVDPSGHYSCGRCQECRANGWAMNCTWATPSEQRRNQRPKSEHDSEEAA